ncbi:MAG: nickel pincer cofactor biosynthesis protein LarC [Candidatus Rifleibacteriota bacterium]
MTTLFWDCFSGIAGNMAVASLLDLGANREKLEKAIASINFEEGSVELIIEEKLNSGIRGIYFNTAEDHHSHEHEHDDAHPSSILHAHEHNHELAHEHAHDHQHEQSHELSHNHKHKHKHGHHHGPHRGMKEIRSLIEAANITPRAREIALKCFYALAEAEAIIHGKSIDEVHFHEVGARDSIVDMVGTAVCLDDLDIDKIVISPVHLGSGMIKCAHGVIPVPAPATALLLKDLPVVFDRDVPFELTTPTGAAILKGMNARPIESEQIVYASVGHGLGNRNIGRPNFLRAFLQSNGKSKKKADFIVQFETNLDNVTGELMGHVMQKLMQNGALDVAVIPATMKKNRPGMILRVIASMQNADKIEGLVFSELPTIGLRKQILQRTILARDAVTAETAYGTAAAKKIIEIDGRERIEVEFDEKVRIAEEISKPLRNLKL